MNNTKDIMRYNCEPHTPRYRHDKQAQRAFEVLKTMGLQKSNSSEPLPVDKGKGKSESIPIPLKVTLTIKEAAAYTNIGINKLEALLREPGCPFVLFIGTKKLVKREPFEEFLAQKYAI